MLGARGRQYEAGAGTGGGTAVAYARYVPNFCPPFHATCLAPGSA